MQIYLPNICKEFASGLTSLLVEKFLLAKFCKWIEKLTLIPEEMDDSNNIKGI